MTEQPGSLSRKLIFRVTPDAEGKVYLTLDQRQGLRIEVARPVTRNTLREARDKLIAYLDAAESADQGARETEQNLEALIAAQREIEAALNPLGGGNLLQRAQRVIELIVIALFQIFIGLAAISFAYRGIQYSSENFAGGLHLAVLAACVLLLAVGIATIATERSRMKWSITVREWFGPRGWLIYPLLILFTSAAVFASITFELYESGMVQLENCRGYAVTEARLLDFYMWHFIKLVPFLSINEVLIWQEPFCYTQSRIGFLILTFQGAVVIPTIATLRFYWKHRHQLGAQTVEYVSGPAPSDSREI